MFQPLQLTNTYYLSQSIYHLHLLLYSRLTDCLVSGPKMNKQRFEDTYDRILQIYDYPLFLMTIFFAYEIGQNKRLHNKLILWWADRYLAHATIDASWQS